VDIVFKLVLVLCAVLIAVIIAQHFFYMREINKLINKLMSRDYFDYSRAEKPLAEQPKKDAPPELPEDLSILQNNFQLP
jgi:hypothetical protein